MNLPTVIFVRKEGVSLFVSLGALFVSLVIILAFFTAYNSFLVDRAIGNLENSLSQIAYAKTIEDMKALKFFLDQLVVSELGEKQLDAKRISGLEFSKTIVYDAKDFRQIRDVKFILEDVLTDRQKQRGNWLKGIDQGLTVMKGWFGLGGKFAVSSASIRRGRDMVLAEKEIYNQAKSHDDHWDLSKAAVLYENLVQKAHDYKNIVDIQFDLAYCYMKLGRLDKAQSLLARIKEQNKGSKDEVIAEALLSRVRELHVLQGEQAALQDKIGQIKNASELQKAYFDLGFLEYKLFDLRKAEQSFRNSAAVDANSAQGIKSLFYLGLALKFHAKPEEAADIFQGIVERFPKSDFAVYSRYQLADAFQKSGQFEKAAQEFEKVAESYPSNKLAALAQFRSGYIYLYSMGDPVRAAAAFDKLKTRFTGEGVSQYSKMEMSPYVKSSVRDFGYVLLQRGYYLEARNAFEQAVKVDSKDAWAYSGLATAQALLGDKKEALKQARQAVEIGPDDYTVGASGYVLELDGNYERAEEQYKKALALNSDYSAVLFNLARLHEFHGKYEEAVRLYQKLTEIVGKSSSSAEVYNNMGHAYWYLGKYLDALEQFKKAVELRPDYLEARFNLASLYEGQNQKDLAVEEYKKILELDPGFRQAEIALETLRKDR